LRSGEVEPLDLVRHVLQLTGCFENAACLQLLVADFQNGFGDRSKRTQRGECSQRGDQQEAASFHESSMQEKTFTIRFTAALDKRVVLLC
jgi:hypothetical protein